MNNASLVSQKAERVSPPRTSFVASRQDPSGKSSFIAASPACRHRHLPLLAAPSADTKLSQIFRPA
jgi:hypothetical protein